MRTLLPAFGIVAGLGVALTAAPAGSIVLVPTTLVIAPGEIATSTMVRNETDAAVAFTVKTFTWQNSPSGEIRLEATQDVVVYPETLSLLPGESRRIRVGSQRSREERVLVEKSYRLLLESLPSPQSASAGAAMTIRTRLQLSLPIFLQPQDRTARMSMRPPSIAAGRALLALANQGRVHVTPSTITMTGHGATGSAVWTKSLHPWYVLAGETRELSADLTADECRRTTTVSAEATFSEGTQLTLREKRPVSPDAVCSPR
jgi:P pilus assembly chaperone PapD